MTIGRFIREWMQFKGLRYSDVLKKSNGQISQTALADYLRGKSKPTTNKLMKLAEILEISPQDLLRSPYETEADYKENRGIPILGVADCGYAIDRVMDNEVSYYNMASVKGLIQPFILIAKGKSMEPMIYHNDKLLCSLIKQGDLKQEMLVVIGYKSPPESAEANAKLIIPHKKSCILYSINPKFPPTEVKYSEIARIYRVVRLIREF